MGEKGETDKTTARAKTIAYQSGSSKASPIPLETCPWCGTKLKPNSFRLVAEGGSSRTNLQLDRAATCRAAFRGKNPLPIVAVDEPLYRRVPCFVIATVDKFASLPWVGASGALLGGADRYDAAGFYGPWRPGIGQKLADAAAAAGPDHPGRTAPDLGSAGDDGRAVRDRDRRAVRRERGRADRAAEDRGVHRDRPACRRTQIRALFARTGVEIFPPPGPTGGRRSSRGRSARQRGAGRLYVGLAAQGRSLKVVLLRTYLALLAAAQKAWVEAGGAKNLDESRRSLHDARRATSTACASSVAVAASSRTRSRRASPIRASVAASASRRAALPTG